MIDWDVALRRATALTALALTLAMGACAAQLVAEAPPEPTADLRKPGVHVCNFSAHDVRLARALSNDDAGGAPDLTVQGWYDLGAGRCRTLFEGPMRERRVWMYAQSADGRAEWAGSTPACVGRGAFETRASACGFGARKRKFREIALRDPAGGAYTHMLR